MLKLLIISLCAGSMLASNYSYQPELGHPQTMAQQESNQDTLKVGDEAPNWKLIGSDGKTYQLSDYKNKKAVVVVWYPAALTGG